MTTKILRRGQLVRLRKTLLFRPVVESSYQQKWKRLDGSIQVKTLTPYLAYAEGLVSAKSIPMQTVVMIVDWSTRTEGSEAWRDATHLVVQAIAGEEILYFDYYGHHGDLRHLMEPVTK